MAEGDYLPRIVEARVLHDRVVHLRFDDGLEGEVDLGPDLWGPVYEPLADDAEFGRMYIDMESIAWPSGADMAPEPLYDQVAVAQGREPLPRLS
jgi:hypothetical protein